ncbi:MAG: hypothetical protein Q9M28_01775 [Mariprofundaceae bacterium]|nr:hypothetical protein [Mariprofundaceae bacterium]
MKKCPFCAEDIQDKAVKCKHCSEFLNQNHVKGDSSLWYFRPTFMVIAFLSVGPLMLPLIWWSPDLITRWKIGITVVIVGVSWGLYLMALKSLAMIEEYYSFLNSL